MILVWVFFSVAAGLFAHIRRSRSGFGWFFIGICFSPIVAWVLLAILPEGEWIDPAIRHERMVYQTRVTVLVIFTIAAIIAAGIRLGVIDNTDTRQVTEQRFDQRVQTELARRNTVGR